MRVGGSGRAQALAFGCRCPHRGIFAASCDITSGNAEGDEDGDHIIRISPTSDLPDLLSLLTKERELLPEKLTVGRAQGLECLKSDEPFTGFT